MQGFQTDYPLVSFMTQVKNRAHCIKRCLDSILAQTYQNVEIVVQDGASTDGTLDLLLEYGDKINLESKPDNDPYEALRAAFYRTRGEIVCWCGSDDEFLPEAIATVVDAYRKNPAVDIIYGDAYRTDINGNITGVIRLGPWDYEKYICDELHILYSSAFLKRHCYEGRERLVGLSEYEIFTELGSLFSIRHIPRFLSKYASHAQSYSASTKAFVYDGEKNIEILNALCDKADVPQEIKALRKKALLTINLHQLKLSYLHGYLAQASTYLKAALEVFPDLLKIRAAFVDKVLKRIKDKAIFIFGAGQHTEFLLADLNLSNGTEILGIIDSEPATWHKRCSGYRIFSPDILLDKKADVLISSFACQEKMSDIVETKYGVNAITLYDKDDFPNNINFVLLYPLTRL